MLTLSSLLSDAIDGSDCDRLVPASLVQGELSGVSVLVDLQK